MKKEEQMTNSLNKCMRCSKHCKRSMISTYMYDLNVVSYLPDAHEIALSIFNSC